MYRFIIDVFILIWVITSFVQGICNITLTRKILIKQMLKKNKQTIEPSIKKIIRKRLFGIIQILFSIYIFLFISFSINWHSAPQATLVIGDNNYHKSDDFLESINSFAKTNNIPGMIVGIIDHDNALLYTYGNKINEKTLFEIGSISKTFTGVMVAEAVHSGTLDLKSSAAELLRKNRTQDIFLDSDVTVEKLVTHTSGFPSIPFTLPIGIRLATLGLTRNNPYNIISEQVMMDYLGKLENITDNEKEFNYSNYGFGFLGHLISRNQNMTYENAMIHTIASRLSMNSTYVQVPKSELKRMATGHHSFIQLGKLNIGRQSEYWDMHDAMAGCGGIRSSGEDMLKYLNAMITQKLPFFDLALKPLYSINDQSEIAMSWLISNSVIQNQNVIWHNGQTGGFNSYIGFVDEKNKGVFILSNLATNDVQPLGEKIIQELMK